MMIYYFLLVIAALLFASQFLFHQKYQNACGMGWIAVLNFNIYSGLVGFMLMWILGKGHLEFSWFSFGVALVYALVNIIYNYASMKSFDTVNLSAYSMFAMLGGMLLPFGDGILWNGEPLTARKIICGGIIAVALLFTISGGQSKGKAPLYYLAVFVMNGMSGVLSSFHQSHSEVAVDSTSFMALTRIVTVAVCLVLQLAAVHKLTRISRKSLIYSAGFAVFCGMGNLFTLIVLTKLPASVQYPILTGGVIVFSTAISAIRKEKLAAKQVVAAALALIATMIIM